MLVEDSNQPGVVDETAPNTLTHEDRTLQQVAAVVTPNSSSKDDDDDEPAAAESQELNCSHTTEEMLESVDSCVGCVNQVALQNDFENSLAHVELPVHQFADTTLTEAEATLIRLQIAEQSVQAQEEEQQQSSATGLADMDLLNLCAGSDANETTAARNIEATAEEASSLLSRTSPAAPVVVSQPNETQCVICSDAVIQIANLPCCKGKDVCVNCIQLVTYPLTDKQRVGHCPCCRTWISVQPNLEIAVVQPGKEQTCSVCNQVKDYVFAQENTSNGAVCDACFLGRRYPLEYECEACHVRQRLPHPMYRYQKSPDEFGQVAWACSEKKCGSKFSHWRICADQIALIPLGDEPWGSPVNTARQYVQQLRRQQFLQEQAEQMQQAQQQAQNCIIL